MTTVATRARRIAELEGFDIIVFTTSGTPVELTDNGVVGSYPYEKRAQSGWTVAEWKEKRFEAVYAGYTCEVLLEAGASAKPQMRLDEVRATYDE